jgi:hypothetical protein
MLNRKRHLPERVAAGASINPYFIYKVVTSSEISHFASHLHKLFTKKHKYPILEDLSIYCVYNYGTNG